MSLFSLPFAFALGMFVCDLHDNQIVRQQHDIV